MLLSLLFGSPWPASRPPQGMSFYTKEEAVAYCKKFGWDFEVREPQETRRIGTVHYRNPRYAQYADNFSVKV